MKEQKQKLQTKATIDSWLARVLFLTKAKASISFRTDVIYFNAKEKELVATNGKTLIVIKNKITRVLIPLNLEEGLYDIMGNILIKRESKTEKITFPPYQSIVLVKAKEICSGNILSGIVECIAKGQVRLDIWTYSNVLKILNGFSPSWVFTNTSPHQPVMMEADNDKYNIKYIIMPIG